MTDSNAWEEVYEIVRLIPPGRVMNYGQVAALCSRPLTPRAVGWAMHGCPSDVPWHRVVNAAGGCCGTTPAHLKAIIEALGDCPPRVPAKRKASLIHFLSSLPRKKYHVWSRKMCC